MRNERKATAERGKAMALGKKTYKGNVCLYGHDGTRYTHNAYCVECCKIKSSKKEARSKPIKESEFRDFLANLHSLGESSCNLDKVTEFLEKAFPSSNMEDSIKIFETNYAKKEGTSKPKMKAYRSKDTLCLQ